MATIIRKYTKDEDFKTFEKLSLNFQWTHENKEYKFLLTVPYTNKTYEKNEKLKNKCFSSIDKFLYEFLILKKKKLNIMDLHKACDYIYVIYLMGYDEVKLNNEYKFRKLDFEVPHRLYLL